MMSFFNKFELGLWITSCSIIIILFFIFPNQNILTFIASLLGATMLIFLAKAHPAGQIMTVIFSLLYAIISYKNAFYGEMITYLGMTTPTAILAAYEWITHPHQQGKAEVKVASINKTKFIILAISTVLVTILFYFILKYLHTANLLVSTISITTSFLASGFMVLRVPYYALAYGANDVVLIILWTMASIVNPSYLPMVICFIIFLVNDVYGYINWIRIRNRQNSNVL